MFLFREVQILQLQQYVPKHFLHSLLSRRSKWLVTFKYRIPLPDYTEQIKNGSIICIHVLGFLPSLCFPIVALKSDLNCACETKTQEAIFIAEQKVIGKHLHFFLCWLGVEEEGRGRGILPFPHVNFNSEKVGSILGVSSAPVLLLWAVIACS